MNGFALGVENAFLQRNVDVGCHKRAIIREEVGTADLGPNRDAESVFQSPSFRSRSASASSSSFRWRALVLASSCCSTLFLESRRLSFARQRAASSGLIAGRRCDDLSRASSCWASTALLSHPRAMKPL